MGWHLYFRDYRSVRRNQDGDWGWIRRPWEEWHLMFFLESIGITIHGDGTCDDDGIAEFARRYPIKGRRCGGKWRGCMEVSIDQFGEITMANPALNADLVNSAG